MSTPYWEHLRPRAKLPAPKHGRSSSAMPVANWILPTYGVSSIGCMTTSSRNHAPPLENDLNPFAANDVE